MPSLPKLWRRKAFVHLPEVRRDGRIVAGAPAWRYVGQRRTSHFLGAPSFIDELEFFAGRGAIALVGDHVHEYASTALLGFIHWERQFQLALGPILTALGEKRAGKIFILSWIGEVCRWTHRDGSARRKRVRWSLRARTFGAASGFCRLIGAARSRRGTPRY